MQPFPSSRPSWPVPRWRGLMSWPRAAVPLSVIAAAPVLRWSPERRPAGALLFDSVTTAGPRHQPVAGQPKLAMRGW